MHNDSPRRPCHACSCHDAVPARSASGVALHAVSTFTLAKLHEAFPERCRSSDAVLVLGDDWPATTLRFLDTLSPIERDEIRAAPVTTQGSYDPWMSLPASMLITRVETPWLPPMLNDDHLDFHFQPIADAADGTTHAVEALVRGDDHGTRRSPGEIIEASRAHNALLRFDQTARRIAIETGASIIQNGERLFVNFLPMTVYDPNVCLRTTFAAAQRVGVSFDRLVFEVVESEQFPDIDHLEAILNKYREQGAGIALDDLGAGNTALSYIDRLKPDYVKLDKALIPLEPDQKHVSLLAGLVHHAKERGIRIIAEGIENTAQLELVRHLDIDLVQGYYIAEPSTNPTRDNPIKDHAARRAA